MNAIYTVVNNSWSRKKLTLVESAQDMGWTVHILKAGTDWHMWKKPLKVADMLTKLPHRHFFVYCDAFDVEVRISPDDMHNKYKELFEDKAVFNAEVNRTLWLGKTPIDYKHHMVGPQPFAYLNAGVFFGRVWALRKVLKAWCENLIPHEEYYTAGKYGCDQAPLLWAWSKNKDLPIKVDTGAKLCLATRGLLHRRIETVPILHRNEGTDK